MTQAPRQRTLEYSQPAISTAGNSDTSILGECPFDATVTGVSYTPDASITGANTNTRLIRVVNRGTTGAGTTVVASLQFDSGVNATAGDERALTLSGTAANLNVAEGEILAFESNAVGTGIADPGGFVQVVLTNR
jgi:hypothetical protein